jgi:hypothetical protein
MLARRLGGRRAWGPGLGYREVPNEKRCRMRLTSDELTEIGRLFRSKLASLRQQGRTARRRPRPRAVRLPDKQPDEAALLSSGELAALLGVSARTVVRWDLPCLRTLGGQRRFRWGDVRARLKRYGS